MSGINIKSILLKSEKEIAKILGRPNKREPGKWRYKGTFEPIFHCPLCIYKNGLFEIKYIEGKAARITIYDSTVKPDEVLSHLGLPPVKIFDERENKISWLNVDGVSEIDAFTENNKIKYIYIIADDKYL